MTVYKPLRLSLDPLWLYATHQVARSFEMFGLLEAVSRTRSQARGAISNWIKAQAFPTRDGSRGGERNFPAWFGWRWQGYASACEAQNHLAQRLRSFWQAAPAGAISIERAVDLAPLTPLDKLIFKAMLRQRAMQQGLNPEALYNPEEWLVGHQPLKHLDLTDLNTLDGNALYSLNDVSYLWSDKEAGAVRASLYLLMRHDFFPIYGDELNAAGVPVWAGYRWFRLILFGGRARG